MVMVPVVDECTLMFVNGIQSTLGCLADNSKTAMHSALMLARS